MQEATPTPSPPKPNKIEDEWDDTWEDLSCELESHESSSDNGASKYESTGENQGHNNVQAQPSFEVLHECPLFLNSDFLKIKEDMFSEQQTAFPFGNMNSNRQSFMGMNQMKFQNAKWLPSPREFGVREFDVKQASTPKITEKRTTFKRKNRKFDGVDFTAGLALGLFATNAFAFVIGFSLGWFSRDSVPTLAVYEYYMDPNVIV